MSSAETVHNKPAAPQNTEFKPPRARDLVTGVITGFVFGFILEKSKVYQPNIIFEQMVFRCFVMLKLFLTASATGMGVYWLLERTGLRQRPPPLNSSLAWPKLGGYGGNIVGGALLGCGMSVAGACPGQVFAQLGAGVPSAPYVLAGGLTATVTFAFLTHAINQARGGKPYHAVTPGISVDTKFGVSFFKIFVGFASVMAAIVTVVSAYFPWRNEIANYVATFTNPGSNVLTEPVWSPVVCAILIGLLQFFAILAGGSPLGQSSCYVTATGCCLNIIDPNLKSHAPYFFKHFEHWHWWQIGVGVANVLGSFVSATLSGSVITAFAASHSPAPLRAFIGGFLMLFGARLGDGCPSGHGLSGMARLNSAAFFTVAAMFGGAIPTAIVLGSI